MANKKSTQKPQRRSALGRAVQAPKQSSGRSVAVATPFVLRSRGVELDAGMRAYIEKRVGFKLARFALAISDVVVRIERPSGPTGAPSVVCRFSIATTAGGKVLVEAVEADARAAFDAANDSAERAVRRLLERRQAKKAKGAGPRRAR